MKSLVLEIEQIKKMMNISESLLTEATVPVELWLKLTKYFDEFAMGGEKAIDDLFTNGRITEIELDWLKKNADEIATLAKNITDPSKISDPVLKKFTGIIAKVPAAELKVLSKKAFNTWLLKNPDKIMPGLTLMDTLAKEFDKIQKGLTGQYDVDIKNALDNGVTMEDLFIFNLKQNNITGDLFDELLERFRKDPRFTAETTEEILQKSIDDLTKDIGPKKTSWFTRIWAEKYPMIHKIIESKLGFGKASSAYNDAVKSAEDLIRLIKDEVNPSEITNLTMKLKSEMIQAQTKTKAFTDIWNEIKVLIDDPTIIAKIEAESGNDAYTSIGKYLDMEQELMSRPSAVSTYKKLKGKDYNLSDWERLKNYLIEWGTMPKWKDVAVKKTYILNSVFFRYAVGVIKWIFKTKLFKFLFWENFNGIASILKSVSKGGLRNFGFWKNVFTTYLRLLIIHHIMVPLSNFISELYNKIVDICGGENVETDRGLWRRTWDASYDDLIRPWVETISNFSWETVAKNIGLIFNPFGKGVIMEMGEDLIAWMSTLGGGLSNEGKKKIEDLEKAERDKFNNSFDEKTKKALELAKMYDDESLNKIAYFKKIITSEGEKYYGLDVNDIMRLNVLTVVEGDSLYVQVPGSEEKIKINLLPNDEYTKRLEAGKDNTKYQMYFWDNNGKEGSLKELASKLTMVKTTEDDKKNKSFSETMNNSFKESRYAKTNNMLTERNKEKFGEDNFKHWKDTFTFKAQDEKNPGQYKEVKIKMEDVMDRINHYRKKYDEDDSFVRAVIDTHEDVVKIMFTKDLANIHESATPRGLALVLRTIKESRGEMEIFSVARPANGNWFLVKGDYTPNQLANMDLEKKEPRTKETEVNSKSEDDLKKKEESAINVLKRNEKEGIEDLPKKIRDKVREKMGKGWTTETPPEELKEYFTTSEINSIFNDKIVIYKLEPTREFFNSLVKYSARIVIKRGFCRTLKSGRNELELSERQKMTVNHILNKCNTKYESKLGLRNF